MVSLGRVAPIADCRGADIPADARPLCNRTPRDRREGAAFHIWNADGPARRNFGPMSRDPAVQDRSNHILRSFATAIIRDRPGEYAELVGDDFIRYFQPRAMSRGNSDLALTFPEHGRLVRRNAEARDRWFPGYTAEVHPPSGLVRSYQERFHAPRRLLGLLGLAGLISLLAGVVSAAMGRDGFARRREVFLLTGAGLAMLLGTAATSEFVLRYLIPAVPLLVCGGLAGAADLLAALGRLRAQRGSKNIGPDQDHAGGDPAQGAGRVVPDRDQDSGDEQREAHAHAEAGRSGPGTLREPVGAARRRRPRCQEFLRLHRGHVLLRARDSLGDDLRRRADCSWARAEIARWTPVGSVEGVLNRRFRSPAWGGSHLSVHVDTLLRVCAAAALTVAAFLAATAPAKAVTYRPASRSGPSPAVCRLR